MGGLKRSFQNIPILRNLEPGNAPVIGIVCYLVFTSCLCSLLFVGSEYLYDGRWWAYMILVVLILLDMISIMIICMHEQFINFSTFKVSWFVLSEFKLISLLFRIFVFFISCEEISDIFVGLFEK